MDNNDLLSCLSFDDREELLKIGQTINSFFRVDGDKFWNQMDSVMLKLIKPLQFDSIVNQLPAPENYHRISLTAPDEPIDVVFLVFKNNKNEGAAVLINTYDSRDPNDKIFSSNMIDNNLSAKPGHIILQTPAHNHKAVCHTCVAWTKNNVTVSEQYYRLADDDTLQLIKNEQQAVNQCGYDNTQGKIIHRISVDFGPGNT